MGESLGGTLLLEMSGSQVSMGGWIEWEGPKLIIKVSVDPSSEVYADFLNGFAISENGNLRTPREIGDPVYFRSRLGDVTVLQLGKPFLETFTIGFPIEVKFYPRFVLFDLVPAQQARIPCRAKAQIGGLTHWLHDSYVTRSIDLATTDEGLDSPYLEVTLRTRDFKPFEFGVDGATVEMSSMAVPERDRTRDALMISFHSMVEIDFDQVVKWNDFVETLLHVQDLVNLLCWRGLSPSLFHVKFRGEVSCGSQAWTRVVNANFERSEDTDADRRYSFVMPFQRLNSEALSIWFMKRAEYAHAMGLFSQVIMAPQMSHEVRALQLGAGIEALGFKILAREIGEEKADKKRAVNFFRRVAQDAKRIFPDDFQNWAVIANENYQAMKHMKRTRPSPGLVAEINDRSTLVIQIWLASTLGASDEEIRQYVEGSPRFTSAYAKMPDPSDLQTQG